MKHKKIALIGMMGCGKSAVSKQLANELGFDLFELDKIFEQRENIKIKDYFAKFGEENFRLIETKLLKEIAEKKDSILSCGGGIILSKENRDILFKKDITTIYLKTSAETIFDRLKNDTSRPLLQVENPKEEIVKILSLREKLYEQAHKTIETDSKTIQEVSKEILKELWKN